MLIEKLEVHDTLNPKIWTSDNKLQHDVRQKILDVLDLFKKFCELTIPVVDIYLVGSNASYNYTDNSDLDMHIIVNFDLIDGSKEVVGMMYNLQRSAFNRDYDISVHGVPIEIYVEDVSGTSVTSNGIYSVFKDKWLKFPKRIEVPIIDTSDAVSRWEKRINYELTKGTYQSVSDVITKLYAMRKNSILVDGEFGKGNQIFKDIRNLGLLSELKDKLKELTSKEYSL
jgi:hypothetical protein